MSLNAKLMVKVRFGNDVRRFILTNDGINFSDFLICLQKAFDDPDKVNAFDNVIIKYKDEDGDLVTIGNDADLTVALLLHRNLNIYVFKADSVISDFPKVSKMLAILRQLRAEVDNLLDITAGFKGFSISDDSCVQSQQDTGTDSPKNLEARLKIDTRSAGYDVASAKEFDPLSTAETKSETQKIHHKAFDGYPKVVKHAFMPEEQNTTIRSDADTSIAASSHMEMSNQMSALDNFLNAAGTTHPLFSSNVARNEPPPAAKYAWSHNETAPQFQMPLNAPTPPQVNFGMQGPPAIVSESGPTEKPNQFGGSNKLQEFLNLAGTSSAPPIPVGQGNPAFANAPLQFSTPFDPNKQNEQSPLRAPLSAAHPSLQNTGSNSPVLENAPFQQPLNAPPRFQPIRPGAFGPQSIGFPPSAPPADQTKNVSSGMPTNFSMFAPVSTNVPGYAQMPGPPQSRRNI